MTREFGDLTEVKEPGDVPRGDHFMVIVMKTRSVTIPGDERSRTNPGHGYPESTEVFKTPEIYVTTDEERLRTALELYGTRPPSYYAGNEPVIVLSVKGRLTVARHVTLTFE